MHSTTSNHVDDFNPIAFLQSCVRMQGSGDYFLIDLHGEADRLAPKGGEQVTDGAPLRYRFFVAV
jgi:hypothetical protein